MSTGRDVMEERECRCFSMSVADFAEVVQSGEYSEAVAGSLAIGWIEVRLLNDDGDVHSCAQLLDLIDVARIPPSLGASLLVATRPIEDWIRDSRDGFKSRLRDALDGRYDWIFQKEEN